MNPRIAELEQALSRASPAEKFGLLIKLSAAIESDDMDRAWDYAQQARHLAAQPRDEILADARIAALQRRRGNYAEALTTAQTALQRAQKLNEPAGRAELLLVIANTYDSLGDFPTALEIFRELLPLAEARNDPVLLARVYNTLGVTYADAGQFEPARQAYETGLRHAEQADDQRLVCSFLNNLGNIGMNSGNYAESRRYHERALALRVSIGGDARGIADSHLNLAELAGLEGRPAEALPHLDQAVALYEPLGLKRNLANAHLSYAISLGKLGRFEEALEHLNAARALAEALNTPITFARVYRAFSAFHEARGDYRAALEAERKLADATEAAVGERSRQRIDSLRTQFEAERREHEIDVLKRDQAMSEAELTRARTQRYGLLALAVLAFIALAALTAYYRLKRRSEKRILAETRSARDAAEQADALKTRLLRMVSHDIRGPIGNVLLLAEDWRDHPPAGKDDHRLELILHEAQHVLDLAQDLLDAAALEAGGLKLQTATVALEEVVQATLGRLEATAANKEQKLSFSAPPGESVMVQGDAARLMQVVRNLVSNAIKYSPRRSTVRVGLRRHDSLILLAVQDEGPGIPAEHMAHLFRPFSRLATKTTGGESSHGLGLSIAHDLVKLHGGRIDVDSPPGGGATFTVELPALAGLAAV